MAFSPALVQKQITQMMARLQPLAALRQEKQFAQGSELVEGLFPELVGQERAALLAPADDRWVIPFLEEGQPDAGRCVVAGELLFQWAQLQSELPDSEHDVRPLARALELYLLGFPQLAPEKNFREPSLAAIGRLTQLLRQFELPDPLIGGLFRAFARAGFVAEAENWFFFLGDPKPWAKEAIAFWEHLLKLPEEQTRQSGLDPEELRETLAQLRAIE